MRLITDTILIFNIYVYYRLSGVLSNRFYQKTLNVTRRIQL